jgi:GT2 family glycosyltransferase
MLDETGLFDEEFFAYADDVDLRLAAGWRAGDVSMSLCKSVP